MIMTEIQAKTVRNQPLASRIPGRLTHAGLGRHECDGATVGREQGEIGAARGNQGCSAGATTQEEGRMPAAAGTFYAPVVGGKAPSTPSPSSPKSLKARINIRIPSTKFAGKNHFQFVCVVVLVTTFWY